MCPIVMSTTYGERGGNDESYGSVEILGGLPCTGISGYIADVVLYWSRTWNTTLSD